jgi:hypothetical protein
MLIYLVLNRELNLGGTMQTNSYIATPIHTRNEEDINYKSDFDIDKSWQKRAHKLQERRWRKLSSKRVKLDDSIDNPNIRLSDYEFRARRFAH